MVRRVVAFGLAGAGLAGVVLIGLAPLFGREAPTALYLLASTALALLAARGPARPTAPHP